MSITDEIEKSIVLDIQKGTTSTIKFYQYDTARRLIIYFTYDNEILDLTGKVPRMYMVKPDGEEIFSDLTVSDAVKGEAQIEFDENMLSVPGTMYCDITIYEGGKTVSTAKFTITISKPLRNDRSITSSSEYASLTAALSAVDNCTTEVAKYNDYLKKIATASPKGSYESLEELKAAYPLGDSNIYLVKQDGSYYVAMYENAEWVAKFKYMTEELEDTLTDLNNRFDNAINSTTTDTEVIDARYDEVENKTYTTLKDRLSSIAAKISAYGSSDIPARVLGMLPATDITTTLKAILATETTERAVIKFEPKATYYISENIELDIRKFVIDGNGALFLFAAPDDNTACITITSTLTSIHENYFLTSISSNTGCAAAFEPLRNLIIQPKLSDSETYSNYTKKGMGINFKGWYDNDSGTTIRNKIANFSIRNVQVIGFTKNVELSTSGMYLIKFICCNFTRGKYNIYSDGVLTDSGENISFSECSLGSNLNTDDVCIYNNSRINLHFQNCSLDYSYKLLYNTGKVIINNCHIETSAATLQPTVDEFCWIENSMSGFLILSNNVMLLGDETEGNTTKYLISNECNSNDLVQGKVSISNNIVWGGVEYWTNKGNIRVSENLYSNIHTKFILATPNINIHSNYNCNIDTGNIFSIYNSSIVKDENIPLTTDNGYEFTHIRQGYATDHYIKFTKGNIIPQGKVSFQLNIDTLSTTSGTELESITDGLVVRFADISDTNEVINKQTVSKTFTLYPGENQIEFYFGRILNTENPNSRMFFQNLALNLRLNTTLINLTKFTVKNLKIETVEC